MVQEITVAAAENNSSNLKDLLNLPEVKNVSISPDVSSLMTGFDVPETVCTQTEDDIGFEEELVTA
jgi:hypothetical protein